MSPTSSERDLIARVVDGDPAAREEFVSRYWRFVRAVALRAAARHAGAAEEVPQEVFVRLFERDCRRLRQWRGDGDFVSWLAPVVRNVTHDFMRSRYGHRPEPFPDLGLDPDYPWDPPDPGAGAQAILVEAERARILENLMLRLGASDREILTAHFLEDVPARVLAERLGIQTNAFYQRLHRALRRLERLAREFHPDLFPRGPRVRPGAPEPSPE